MKEILIKNQFNRLLRIPDTAEWRAKIKRNNWEVVEKNLLQKYNKSIDPKDNKVLDGYKCPFCGKVFETVRQYKGHLLGAHLQHYKKSVKQMR